MVVFPFYRHLLSRTFVSSKADSWLYWQLAHVTSLRPRTVSMKNGSLHYCLLQCSPLAAVAGHNKENCMKRAISITFLFGALLACVTLAETPGERFARAIEEIEAGCAHRKLEPNEVCGGVTKLKPADPLATEEGRFAHSIKIPNPVAVDSGYKAGMTSEQYFDHLCKTEAGEFIYKIVDNVDGLYLMRLRQRVFDDYMQHLYAMEDPYGYTDWEGREPQTIFIDPPYKNYSYIETSLPQSVQPKNPAARYRRFTRLAGDKSPIIEVDTADLGSRYGYTWRGISRPHDRDLGIAGGELIVLDLQTKEVLGVRRGYIRSGNVKNSPTGIWWLTGEVCPKLGMQNNRPKDGDFSYWFISKVLKPVKA